ncbi:hypothetical protein H257_06165 [Aphanomyces astaci]|uniref:Major facilitator superfamily (MFS) profile domain-containing protein n=1 Tax=Aphanomyces astaci TaxID=112090 RepID=W4GP50_APHAT|nr:hypothetical protein H257_06165 [Aphanomyces astaci]ETV80643.1 hypothetical protein H257_06165 [Aphanomyces astaci]RQM21762.1 hypothetical protein B5M09_012886 [Aphanomyces astaci]|eukprot:XP_009829590.1 hypothetical protein H257_06165 [Aphanomyces astaci]
MGLADDQLWPAKAMYGINNFALSTVLNFLPVFFNTYFDKLQIGILAAIPCVCSVVAPPLWGAMADVLHQQRWVHIFCILSGTLLMFLIEFSISNFYLTCVVVFVANFQTNPTGSLLDQAVMALLHRVGGEYGKQRLFGAVGWGVGAFLTGLVVNTYGISWAFNLHLIFCVPTLCVLNLIPPADPKDSTSQAPTLSFWEGMRRIGQKADVVLLLVVVFLIGLMFGVVSSFLTLNLYELSNHSTAVVGTAIWFETLSELPAFYFADAVLKRLGILNVLLLSILGYGVRISYYAVMTNAWSALPFELLHGATFSLAWAACTQYIYDAAPPGTEGTMMGLLNAVLNGLGRGTGTLLGGYLYEHYGASFMWFAADLGVPVALVGLFLFSRTMPNQQPLPPTLHSTTSIDVKAE